MKTEIRRRPLATVAITLSLLLTGCAAGQGGVSGGAAATLPPPPETIAPMTASAHQAALHDLQVHQAATGGSVAGLQTAAAGGNPVAQGLLGDMYALGERVPHDPAEAARHYHAAALAGYASAQTNLGDLYENGDGVPRDQAMANRWYAVAAAQGEDTATSRLAMAMIKGDGMTQDVPGALKLLHHCAAPEAGADIYHPSGDLGGPTCQALLGGVYLEGDGGVPVDLKQGIDWLTQSAQQHMPRAEKHLADCYARGTGVAKDEAKAAYWRQRAEADADIPVGHWTGL